MALSRRHVVLNSQVVVRHCWSLLSKGSRLGLLLFHSLNGRQASILLGLPLNYGHGLRLWGMVTSLWVIWAWVVVVHVFALVRVLDGGEISEVRYEEVLLAAELGHPHHPSIMHHVCFLDQLVGVLGLGEVVSKPRVHLVAFLKFVELQLVRGLAIDNLI